mmetsp:Transcript_28910/g.66202  ORF Transcript_28910/g.66202 Transcript_28910/m.66202 type:complete len:229 (-) Transcript_28910:72-758(-)
MTDHLGDRFLESAEDVSSVSAEVEDFMDALEGVKLPRMLGRVGLVGAFEGVKLSSFEGTVGAFEGVKLSSFEGAKVSCVLTNVGDTVSGKVGDAVSTFNGLLSEVGDRVDAGGLVITLPFPSDKLLHVVQQSQSIIQSVTSVYNCKLNNVHTFAGIEPCIILSSRYSLSRFSKSPKALGMVPSNWFSSNLRVFKEENAPRISGNCPDKTFSSNRINSKEFHHREITKR